MWTIVIKNIGKPQEKVKVFGDDGFRRPCEFKSKDDAQEACRIIRSLRIDTAFEWCAVIEAIT